MTEISVLTELADLTTNARPRSSSGSKFDSANDFRWAVSFLKEIVEADSCSPHTEGVSRVQQRVAGELEELGFTNQLLSNKITSSGPLLWAERAGKIDRFITVVSHADTVLPAFGFHLLSETQAQGSGVIDNKGGLTVALLGLKLFLRTANKHNRFGLRFISSPNEELGSVGFLEDLQRASLDSVLALGFEPALDDGSIIQSRRGNRWYKIHVQGKEAHAGRSYGEHANAAHQLALHISRLVKLNNLKKHISVNIGRIEGGRDKYNVVCGWAEAKLDTRFANFSSRDRLHRKIAKILGQQDKPSLCGLDKSQTGFEIVDDCPPFNVNLRSRGWVRAYTEIISAIEAKKISARAAGGAGDVNHLSRKSIIVLDGLGPVGSGMHTDRELVHLPSILTRAQALAQFLQHFSEGRS